ncbi:rCG20270 [Rattus norvegicus]|uniref:RCG20270 n=1 Tax=Rattus norvegicus TaxID=10116 RepID=A6JGH6_RAT|nr:rCG20270 [Rattus norvegicus]
MFESLWLPRHHLARLSLSPVTDTEIRGRCVVTRRKAWCAQRDLLEGSAAVFLQKRPGTTRPAAFWICRSSLGQKCQIIPSLGPQMVPQEGKGPVRRMLCLDSAWVDQATHRLPFGLQKAAR